MTSSNRTRARRGAFVVAVAFGLIAAACGGDDGGSGGSSEGSGDSVALTEAPQETQAPAAEIVMGGKLVVGGEAEVSNPWTPQAMQCDSFCQMRARSFYDPLVVVDENLDWQPFLAEKIEPNADNTVFTVTIRQGIKFHDGTDLDAAAVMDNLNRGAKGLLISAALVDLARDPACFAAAAGGSVIGCDLVMEQIDDFTFTIATGKSGDLSNPLPWPGFPYYFGGQWGLIASPTWLAEVDADGTKAPNAVGTGPFVLDSYAPGDKLIVKKNPNYWIKDAQGNALPYLDEIEYRVIPDSQVRAAALESGDLDLMATSDAGVLLDLQDNPDFPTLLQNQYGETNYILLHLTKPFLADQSVRCALLQALDKQDIIDVIDGGNGVPATGPFSPGQEGFLEDNGSLPFDPEAAAAAIEAYEAANGPLTINYSTTTASRSLQVAQYLQDVWGQVGVDVTITQIEQSKLINNALFGDPAFDAFGWRNHAGLFADQQYFWWHSSAALPDGALALNFGRLNDPQIDQYLEEARSGATNEDRQAAAENLNRRFAEGCFIIPTSYTQWGIVHNTSVQGIGQTPTPDGNGSARDGAGFPGQVWLTAVFKTA
ncbi:MAG: ABC transporter substrate-binding protein [Actinomycetota bacterium]